MEISVFLQTLNQNPVGITVTKIFILTPESDLTESKTLIFNSPSDSESVESLHYIFLNVQSNFDIKGLGSNKENFAAKRLSVVRI